MTERLASIARDFFLVAAFALGALAVWEKLANQLGRTLVFIGEWYPFRILELAAICLLFAIALQLRDIRRGLTGREGSA